MKLRNQIVVVNVGIAAALGLEAVRGASVAVLLIVGVTLCLIVNVIFWNRIKKLR